MEVCDLVFLKNWYNLLAFQKVCKVCEGIFGTSLEATEYAGGREVGKYVKKNYFWPTGF
jgi:hypothetical protein